MKILVVNDRKNASNGLRLVADSAWRPDRRPLFVPEGRTMVDTELRVAVRVSRLGKCIGREFAGRYYDAWALVALQDYGHGGEALMADDTLVTGPWQELDRLPAKVTVGDAEAVAAIDAEAMAATLEELSQGMTLKTGDVVVAPGALAAMKLRAPMTVKATDAEGNALIEFNIR